MKRSVPVPDVSGLPQIQDASHVSTNIQKCITYIEKKGQRLIHDYLLCVCVYLCEARHYNLKFN